MKVEHEFIFQLMFGTKTLVWGSASLHVFSLPFKHHSSIWRTINLKGTNAVIDTLFMCQGECWFDATVPLKSSLKESMPLNSSQILSEQLKTLEKNALLFSRGCVYKNDVKVSNRQPDYEFFVSRKH